MGGGNPAALRCQSESQPLAQDANADKADAGSPFIQGATPYVEACLWMQKESHARAWQDWGACFLLWPSRSTFDPSGPLLLLVGVVGSAHPHPVNGKIIVIWRKWGVKLPD